MSDSAIHPLSMLARIAAALVGGYAFTFGFAAFAIAALSTAGVDFHEAEHGTMLLAFLVFLLAFLWSFAARSVLRIWAVLAGGGITMTLAATFLQRNLLG